MKPLNDYEIEQKIEEFFDRNYELLRAEGNRPLTAELRQKALNQVKMYFQKLKGIATQVTDTEVKLTLPEQRTPEGRRFAIEGVVDIVREDDETWMYDIKTHQPELIREDLQYYAEQLNVYTYIWQNLRQNKLDRTAVISTTFPRKLERALKENNPALVAQEFAQWDPVIEIPFEQENVTEMIASFGTVVDQIENKEFAAPPKEKLGERYLKSRGSFGTKVCRFCDARYSCSAYRAFAAQRYQRGFNFRHFFREDMDEFEQENFLEGNLAE
jgi:hypothetical protein